MTQATQASDNRLLWNRSTWLPSIVNAAIVAIVFALFNHKLPNQVPLHFDLSGQASQYTAKWAFWLIYAALTILLPVLMTVTRAVDPRNANYVKFGPYYDLFRWGISLFLQVVLVAIVVHESGSSIAFHNVLLGAFGVLWMLLGNQMGRVRSNYFIGIRTPWTLNDDETWKRTHRFGARLWFATGLVMFALAWFVPGNWAAPVVLAGALGSALAVTLYSYVIYRRKTRSGH